MARHLPLLLLLTMLLSTPLRAQQEDDIWQDLLEQWADHNETESIPDDLVEQLTLLREQPLNLNDTNSDIIYLLPFLTDYHVDAIKAYIQQNGEMASLAELHNISAFDTITIRLVSLFAIVAPVPHRASQTLKDILSHGHSSVVLGTKTTRPKSRGYLDGSYLGDPFRLYARYQFKYNDHISFLLAADKDAGEPLLATPYRLTPFDYYSYHLMISDIGSVKRFVVGKYHLQFGQGLTLWSGFAPWMSGSMPLRRYGQGIRPASAFCEYGFLNGAAATLRLPLQMEVTLFLSHVRRDATGADTVAPTDLFADDYSGAAYQSIYQSGYHRTTTEISKKRLLPETLYGAHLQWRHRNLLVGATAYATHFASPIVPANYVYNAFAFSGQDNFNAGIDATYRYRRMLLFGEVALAHNRNSSSYDDIPLAALAGFQFRLNANNSLSAAWRHGAPSYHNLHANSIGQSDNVQNEKGICFSLESRLPGNIILNGYADIFRFPWMRYRIYSPSTGADLRLTLSKDIAPHTTLSAQYRYKESQRNSDAERYYVEQTCRQQLLLSLDYKPSDCWRLLSRVAMTRFSCEEHPTQNGFVALQQIEYHSSSVRPFTLAARLALFDVSGYDARLFTYENELQYEYSVPMLTGQGIRFFILYRQQLGTNIRVSFKYSLSYYPENENISSGYNLIEGNKRHEFKLQLNLKF